MKHNHTIVLAINRAERIRGLNIDRVHSRDNLVEIEMSTAQWGALISSIGMGSGVPVTIRRTESVPTLPDIPYEPRLAENLSEVSDAVTRILAQARASTEKLESAITDKQGAKAIREALSSLNAALGNAENNAKFAVTSLERAAEHVVSQARSDIEAHMYQTAQTSGLASPIQMPEFGSTAAIEPTPEG
ncbi:hypothetical protein [Leucobacter sp. cx-169]|uniref:hypothetical protein n=1 Tax=Leucobacter sp. cx-169 TaxID=2770549 RepID=UPI00165E1A7A|nr:hypothetical protein [Leucobacter sp. cx-169]MBC9927175.1 hypothetical protein [Leucobacter sp. cx-169]